ncbi:MAG: hypothetical protein INH41_10380, partial [Myxococcaceae bacterium]|nr:hypothetical protein [Myxococcaceae bacterium]
MGAAFTRGMQFTSSLPESPMNARLLALLTSMLALTACGVDSALVD